LFLINHFLDLIIKKNNKNIILKKPISNKGANILFLHHSTGRNIWNGGVKHWFKKYNDENSHPSKAFSEKVAPYFLQ
jgi:hypothetical protein